MFDIYCTILNLLINIIVFDPSIPVAYMYTCTIIAGWVGGVLNIVQNTKKMTFQNLCNINLHKKWVHHIKY